MRADNGGLKRATAECGTTDLWSAGVTVLEMLTQGILVPALQSDLFKHPMDSADLNAFKIVQWLVDFGKSTNKFEDLKKLFKRYESNLEGKIDGYTHKIKRIKNSIDFIKKFGLHSDVN